MPIGMIDVGGFNTIDFFIKVLFVFEISNKKRYNVRPLDLKTTFGFIRLVIIIQQKKRWPMSIRQFSPKNLPQTPEIFAIKRRKVIPGGPFRTGQGRI